MILRRVLILVVVVLVVAAGLHMLVWRWAEQQLAAGFAAWVAVSHAQGWNVAGGQPVQSGWPFSATLTVPDLFVSGGDPDLPGGLTWSADRVVLRVELLRPRSLAILPEGMQRLRLGELPEIPYTADYVRIAVPLEPGVPVRSVSVRAINLRAGIPAAVASQAAAVTAGTLDLHAEWTPAAQQNEPAVAVALRASDIGLPPGRVWPLGPRLGSLELDGALGGPLPRVPGLAARVAAWRDGGGTVDIKRLALVWGPLDLAATATVALDDALQPMGTGTAHLQGAAATLDALVANRTIADRAAVAAKALLALMSHPAPGGGSEVEVPLTLQGRRLSAGRIPLMRLPELVWPP